MPNVTSVSNPNIIGLELENQAITFANIPASGSSAKSARLAVTSTNVLDDIPLFAVTFDSTFAGGQPILEVVSGPSDIAEYGQDDFFTARDLVLQAFQNVAVRSTEQERTIETFVEEYNVLARTAGIDPRYQLDTVSEFRSTTFNIDTDVGGYSPQINYSIAYDAIGDQNSGFRELFLEDFRDAYSVIRERASALADQVAGGEASANLRSLFTHLFLTEIQPTLVQSENLTFYTKEGSAFLFRVSGEDVVNGILSNQDVLTLRRWLSDNTDGAFAEYDNALKNAASDILESPQELDTITSDTLFEARFRAVFETAVNNRIESDRSQLGNTVDYSALEPEFGQEVTDFQRDGTHLSIPDSSSRLPIRENSGRHYIVFEDRATNGANARSLNSGSAAWNPANADSSTIRNIVELQSFPPQPETTVLNRGGLLTRVALDTWAEGDSLTSGLINALQAENQHGNIEHDRLVDNILDHADGLNASRRQSYAERVLDTFEQAPELLSGVERLNFSEFVDLTGFDASVALVRSLAQGLPPSAASLPSDPQRLPETIRILLQLSFVDVQLSLHPEARALLEAKAFTLRQLTESGLISSSVVAEAITEALNALADDIARRDFTDTLADVTANILGDSALAIDQRSRLYSAIGEENLRVLGERHPNLLAAGTEFLPEIGIPPTPTVDPTNANGVQLQDILFEGLPSSLDRTNLRDALQFLLENRSLTERQSQFNRVFEAIRDDRLSTAETERFIQASSDYYTILGDRNTGAQDQQRFRSALGLENLRTLQRSEGISSELTANLGNLLAGLSGGGGTPAQQLLEQAFSGGGNNLVELFANASGLSVEDARATYPEITSQLDNFLPNINNVLALSAEARTFYSPQSVGQDSQVPEPIRILTDALSPTLRQEITIFQEDFEDGDLNAIGQEQALRATEAYLAFNPGDTPETTGFRQFLGNLSSDRQGQVFSSLVAESLPQNIHTVWLGGELTGNKPNILQQWKDINPNYEVNLWYDEEALLGIFFDNLSEKLLTRQPVQMVKSIQK